jgi:hypothetical protein
MNRKKGSENTDSSISIRKSVILAKSTCKKRRPKSDSGSSLSDSIEDMAEDISSEEYGSSSCSSFHFSEDSIERELSE